MDPKEPLPPPTQTMPHASMGQPATVPLLPVCCACGLIRDETESPASLARWVTQRTYRKSHGVNPADLFLTHTYCPECFMKARELLKRHFRKADMPP